LDKKINISVCIATYNGEKYILKQLESILVQLDDYAEVIISDDSSTDNTVNIIRGLNDPRIKLFEGNSFRNPINNFEFCISKANGEIIFLSDQDDWWLSNKVNKIISAFKYNPLTMLVSSDAKIVNDNDTIIHNNYYRNDFKFTSGIFKNIIKNRFVGCTLAFRSVMKDKILPFPSNIPMHDIWIGVICKLYGQVTFIDEPLISYRRHSANFTRSTHSRISQIICWRFDLITSIIKRVIKLKMHKTNLLK
jgi:glycosyltransferase involved in cell wall biosynthesis